MAEILDMIVIFLLVIAIIYGTILNRKISLLQESKKELANLFKSFDDTILKAQIGIDDLKNVSEEISGVLQQKMDKASMLIDDLEFLSEKVGEITDLVDKKIKKVQKKVAAEQGSVSVVSASQNSFSPSPQEIKAMRMREQRQVTDLSPQSGNVMAVDKKKAKVLEGLLERINDSKSVNSASRQKRPAVRNAEVVDEEKTVAEMLKAMGYGEN